MTRSNHPLGPLLFLGVLALGGCTDEEPESVTGPDLGIVASPPAPPERVSVYTQNMFLGGDTGPLFTLDFADIPAVIAATAGFYAEVLASDIPSRVASVAYELQEKQPRAVALQEAVGYATGTLDPASFAFTPTAPGPDLLGSLLGEIERRGLPYRVAVLQPTSAIALPMGAPTAQGLPALAVQDRLVLLVRDDVEVSSTGQGLFAVNVVLGPIDVARGWVSATVRDRETEYHIVATHLETQGTSAPGDPLRAVHNAQAAELQAVMNGLDGDVILLGDLNSDALADPSEDSWTPTYGGLVDAGFIDVWAEAPHRETDDGGTCCLLPGRELDERIDFVMLRPGASADREYPGRHRGFFRAEVVGTEPVAEGIWPSDHAGLTATIRRTKRPRR